MKVSVKEALLNYLTKYAAWNEKQFGYRPRGSYVPDAIYDGPAEDEFDYWKPVEIKETFDFEPLEDEFGFKIHGDLKVFLTSYYYYDTSAEIGEYYVKLRTSTPKTTPIQAVYRSVVGSIQMGFDPQIIDFADAEFGDDDGYLVLFHNVTGKIYVHEHWAKNQDNLVYLAESMEDFLNKLASSFE